MLEPSAVTPTGETVEAEVEWSDHAPPPAQRGGRDVVGADWAERLEPNNVLVAANRSRTRSRRSWSTRGSTRPTERRRTPGATRSCSRGPWPKAFLSSRRALRASVAERMKKVGAGHEHDALQRLLDLADRNLVLKQANGAELWAKIVACRLFGGGRAGLSLVGERFGARDGVCGVR